MKAMKEIHLTRKDFTIEWFSGQGGGGQHRNKHANCCRIRHPETGLSAQSTKHRSREANKRDAFEVLAKRIVAHYRARAAAANPARRNPEVIRTYHGVRNQVLDHKSRRRASYKRVVVEATLDDMIEARRLACMQDGDDAS